MMSHGRLVSVVAFAFLLAGCGKEEKKKTGWATFPAAVYVDSTIMSSPGAEADFREAMAFWESRAGKQLFDYRGVWTSGQPFEGDPNNPGSIFANVVMFLNPWPYSSSYAAQTVVRSTEAGIQGSVILVNPHMHFCTGSCTQQSFSTSSRMVFTHELGHFLGLAHVDDKNNIMYPQALSAAPLSTVNVDQAALSALTN